MKDKEILQFEEDDTAEIGMNGKHVFFTKRINGKTTHNKGESKLEEEKATTTLKNDLEDEDLFIEFKTNVKIPEEKPKKTKRKKKKHKKAYKILTIFVLLLIIIGTIVFAMISPIFNVKEIQIEGNEILSSQKISSLSGITVGENIFRISKKDIENNIKENAYIESVSMKRYIPDTIVLTVKERTIDYQIQVIDSYVYLDYQGYILEKSSKQENVPLLKGFSTSQNTLLNGKRVNQDDIEKLRVIFKIMEFAKNEKLSNKIQEIEIKNAEYMLKIKNEDIVVYLGSGTNLNNKIKFLSSILENESGNNGEIFLNGDMNSGFKPYFRDNDIEIEKKSDENNSEEVKE